ncbi:MAG: type I-F CRISPR-associated protein Csy3 [Spirobacillus cienkowskii]|jgi:CRISPR-associated protein Csy3|uniref:Type I-F CRISPR-associated protein Csy3 n=1 Tax=Spirobacillus cienkowskii TaxID=495820 RepID=A0A369KQH9_9BACT|nr:MAG: type I-F CRISPR-associated protein Csy3 [Spirobacillus cienkowskii]
MQLLQPSLLSYSRSIQTGKGLFYAIVNHEGKKIKTPVTVEQTSIRGTQSSHSAGQSFYDENPDKPNLQRIEVAHLPANSDTFECVFSLNVLGKSIKPDACNDEQFIEYVAQFLKIYTDKNGYAILAQKYVNQILNGSWLWRNRDADNLTITIKVMNRTNFLEEFNNECQFIVAQPYSEQQKKFLQMLIDQFAAALSGKSHLLRLEITASGKIGLGQEIFPSQEFVEKDKMKDDIGRVLAKTSLGTVDNHAYLHPQKIGNALRTIDTWYSNASFVPALPVEPYGVDSKMQKAMRVSKDSKNDFYSLVENIISLTEELKASKNVEEIPGNVHFVVGCLVRGGVFSYSSQESVEKRKKKEAEKASKKQIKKDNKKIGS